MRMRVRMTIRMVITLLGKQYNCWGASDWFSRHESIDRLRSFEILKKQLVEIM